MTTSEVAFEEAGSSSWQGGYAQEQAGWCFAAAEQTIRASLGASPKPQAERAYENAVALMQAQSLPGYFPGEEFMMQLMALSQAFNGEFPTWDQAKDLLPDNLIRAVQELWGVPNFDDIGTYATALSLIAIKHTVDNGGLIAVGNQNHWRVVFGYTVYGDIEDENGMLWIFDPMSGDTSTQAYTEVAGVTSEAYFCGG